MSKRHRNNWSVSALPGVLRANARVVDTAASAQEAAASTLGDATRRLGLAAAYRHEADVCRDVTLPLYWVTADMAQVALDASQDMPVLSVGSAPTKRGFLAIAGGVPPLPPSTGAGWATLDGGRITDGITPSALLWETAATKFTLTIYAHESVMPGGSRLTPGPLQEINRLVLSRDEAGQWPGAADMGGAGDAANPYLAVMSWVCAAWHLMMMPTVAQRTRVDPATGGTLRSETTPEREVTYIDLRPLRQVATPEAGEAGDAPTRTHRWVVRGHWVQQPHGPGRALRRVQWRESYIKGPAGAPLKRSRPVNVWRR